MPQLIWFLIDEQFDVVEQLIKRGVNVNVVSQSGDTPVLISLEIMNITNLPYASLDERLPNLETVKSYV